MKKKNLKSEGREVKVEAGEITATENTSEVVETVVNEFVIPEAIVETPASALTKAETEEKTETPEVAVPSESVETSLTSSKTEATVYIETKDEKADDNVSFVNRQIDKLIALKEEKNFTDFWFYVKELNTMIFTLKGIAKEERYKFKDRIGELCVEAKAIQEEIKLKVSKTSGLKLEKLKQILEEAFTYGSSHEELEKSFVKVEEANKFLREGIVTSEDGEASADMSRGDREKAKELLKKAKDQIFERKRAVREENFKRITDRLNAISDNLMSHGRSQNILSAIKKLRSEMHNMTLDRTQVRDIDNVINTIWKKAVEKINHGNEYDAKKKMSDLEYSIKKKEQFIQTLESEIKELGMKWKGVKNDFFKNRVDEWGKEKQEKIVETRKEIESIKEKIKFFNEKAQRT